jgi:fumarate hydratase class II
MMPGLAYNLNQEIVILTNALRAFESTCVQGLQADIDRCRRYADASSQVATALNPVLGYEKVAEIVKKAVKEGKTIRQVVVENGLLSGEMYDQSVRLQTMVDPHGRCLPK